MALSPKAGKPNTGVGKAKALSQLETIKDTPEGRKIAILAGDGVDAADVKAVQDALLNAKAVVEVVGTHQGALKAADGSDVPAPVSVLTAKSVMYDAVYVPGGADSAAALASNADAVHFVQEAFKHYKPVGAAGRRGGLPGQGRHQGRRPRRRSRRYRRRGRRSLHGGHRQAPLLGPRPAPPSCRLSYACPGT